MKNIQFTHRERFLLHDSHLFDNVNSYKQFKAAVESIPRELYPKPENVEPDDENEHNT